MRRFPSRVVRPLALSLVILACATENAVGPKLNSMDLEGRSAVAAPIGPKVVISQVYGGGGNSGAPFNRDFIELFNAGDTDQSLAGWSVQYASATGPGNFGANTGQLTPLAGTIAAGQYVLIEEAVGTTGANLPVGADITDATPINMSGTAGKVALVTTAASLGCNGSSAAPCNPAAVALIVDLVGYGSANYSEAAAAPGLSNSAAAIRKENGCLDTNNNAADFAAGTPAPRNRQTVAPCVQIEPPGPVTTVAIAPADGIVFVGGTQQYTALGTDADGRSSPSTYRWSSSNPAILAIGATTGLATAVGLEGTVTITALSANDVSGTTTASVTKPGGVGSIVVSINTPREIPVGYTKPAFLAITGGPPNQPPNITWTSSDTQIATVDNLGYITGVGVGTAAIKAAADNGVFGTRSITILPATAPTTAVYRNHVEFGTPTDGSPGDDYIMSKPQYVISYNGFRGAPNWVSWNLNASHFGPVRRCDCFSADQTLPAGFYRVVDFDYRNSGYDRGHMVQSEPRTTTEQENASTFLMTNIVPQASENNQGPWSRFENYLNDLARRDGKEIYVVTGGQYSPNPATLKNEGKVQIPEYTWKVAVVINAGEGIANVTTASSLQVFAVKMPNLETAGGPASAIGLQAKVCQNPPPGWDPRNVYCWEDYKTTVNAIETAIGYDLLSNLPDRLEQMLEGGHEPVAVIGGENSGVEGAPVSFNGAGSSDADGDQLEYTWTFGDGQTATGISPTYTYADDAAYTVELTVTDPNGGTSTASRVVNVTNAKPVVTGLTATNIVSGGTVSALASFTDAGTKDNPWTYSFSWGSGTPAIGISQTQGSVGATRSFSTAGTYTVSFSVTDKDGGASVRTTTFQVSRLASGLLVSPDQVNISNSGNGQIKVVVLGSSAVDASLIDVSSARIGRTAVDAKGNFDYKSQLKDVDGDGQTDLELHFERGQLVRNGDLSVASHELVLLANLTDGRQIRANGPVETK